MISVKQTLLAFTFSVYGLIACNNITRQNNSENQNVTFDTSTTKKEVVNKTIIYDNYSYPIDSSFIVKTLTVGNFHGDEVWENVNNEKWFGLFQGKAGFYIAETKLKTKRINDPIVDENENDKTGWEVRTEIIDSSIILFEEIDYISPDNVQYLALSKKYIFPGDTLQISFLGIDYKIFATGEKKEVQDDPEWYDVWNYKLYLTTTIKEQDYKSLLVAKPNFDDQMICLLFAGDIDGDKILDLIINTSSHYNLTRPTIYLSKPANKNEIIKPVGSHTSVGC